MTKILTNRIIRGAMYSVLGPATLVAGPVYSQNTPQTASGDTVEEVVVTGIRESLNKARDIKRDATQFVDAIVADDIGKLPDRNVAESLARVSGVQVDRGIAEGTSVSVRGLRQNVYLFNGRQIIDPTGRGGIGLETLGTSTFGLLALVPSELIARLELTKLASADQISGALGGIVDVQTPMPLDGPSRLGAKVGGIYYDQASENGYEAFALASQKFAGDTLGVLVSASYNKRDLSQEGLDTFSGYSRFTDATGTVRFGNADARPEAIAEERKNLGLNGVLQWQPSDGVELIADTFYSELEFRSRPPLAVVHSHRGPDQRALLSQQHPAVGDGERPGADEHGVPRHRRRHLVLGVARQFRRDRPAARQRRGRVHQVDLDRAPGVFPPAADRRHHADRELRFHAAAISAPTRSTASTCPTRRSCATRSCSTTPSSRRARTRRSARTGPMTSTRDSSRQRASARATTASTRNRIRCARTSGPPAASRRRRCRRS